MIKLNNTTGGSLTANQTIPLTEAFNSNNNLSFNNNEVIFLRGGYYQINGNFTVTSTTATTPIKISLLNGTNVLASSTATFTAVGDTFTINLNDVEKVIPYGTSFTKISFQVDTACTLDSANVSVINIK